jgi:hypothetical protein
MVEDAVLTIEAIPIPEIDDESKNDGDETNDETDGFPTDDASATSGSAGKVATPATTDKKTPKLKEPPKRDTVGDRVLADIGLARLISLIPHLFLRDVRVRLIIRNEPPNKNDTAEPNPDDTMVEIGIDFLSVASGEDILSRFQENEDDFANTDEGRPPAITRITSLASVENITGVMEQNEFLFRHIRTGKGPDAGLWIRVYEPERRVPSRLIKKDDQNLPDSPSDSTWAREHWVMATDFYLLRCSGLDIQARVYLGTKQEAQESWWYYEDDEFEYNDEFAFDSFLMGVDHIAPGPQLPLPPMREVAPSSRMARQLEESEVNLKDRETFSRSGIYFKDENGIKSCKIPSNFHRFSRGMSPGSCKDCSLLPSENCSSCWEIPIGVKSESKLDKSIPMPGLALQLSLRDPLEINADRSSLDTIGLVRSIFQGTESKAVIEEPPEKIYVEDESSKTISHVIKSPIVKEQDTRSSGFFDRFTSNNKSEPELIQKESSDAFSPLMQPEKIQIMGIHVSEILLRIHVMRDDKNENNFSFCYWDIEAECLTLDRHSYLSSSENQFSDLTFEIGYLNLEEFLGQNRKTLISAGMSSPANRGRSDSESFASATSMTGEGGNEAIWPSTASVLLEIPPPPETLIFRNREYHGLQLRFISMSPSPSGKVRSTLNARLGVASINAPWSIIQQLGTVRRNIMSSIAVSIQDDPEEVENPSPVAETPKLESLMSYSVQIDSVICKMAPKLSAKMPLTRFSGERSSETGLFFETVAEKLKFAWGQQPPSEKRGLSLRQLAALPESVRMRILLCLDDLQPLEQSFFLKTEDNPFKRCQNVNKGIKKIAKKISKKSLTTSKQKLNNDANEMTKRQQILKEILKFDDKELDELWALHQKNKRKLARKRQA